MRRNTFLQWFLFFALGAWVVYWGFEYFRLEFPQIRDYIDRDWIVYRFRGVPWEPMIAAGALGVFCLAFVQIGGWVAGGLGLGAMAEPDSPCRRLFEREELALSASFGALITGLLVLGLGLAGVGFPLALYPVMAVLSWPLWAVLGISLVMAFRAARRGRWRGGFGREGAERKAAPLPALERGIWAALWFYMGLIGLYALTPTIQSDGLRYHMAAAQEYVKTGRIEYLPYQAFTNFPFLIEMFFTLGLGAGSDLLAKGFHWAFFILSVLWVYLAVAQAMWSDRPLESPLKGRGGYGALGAMIFATTPTVGIVAAWSFIDLGVTAFFMAFIYALSRWSAGRERKWLIAAGALGGACLGAKYTMVPLVGLGGLWVAALSIMAPRFGSERRWAMTTRRFVLMMTLAGAIGAPWYLKNLAWTGNPVYPMAWGIFGGGEWSEANAGFFSANAGQKGFTPAIRENPWNIPKAVALSPYMVTFRWRDEKRVDPELTWRGYENHNIGVIYFLLTPVLLAWVLRGLIRFRRDPVRATWALFIMGYCVLWFFTYQSARFLIPLLALFAVAGADSARWLTERFGPGRFSPARWIWAAALFAATLQGAWTLRWIYFEKSHPAPLAYTLGMVSREEYLNQALAHYDVISKIDDTLNLMDAPGGTSVLFYGEHRGTYCEAPYRLSDWFDTPLVLDLIRQTENNDALLDRLLEEGTGYVFINLNELNKYNGSYEFQSRFRNDEERRRFESFPESPRLRKVYPPPRSRFADEIFLARILPSRP